jgi:hypothetical protein
MAKAKTTHKTIDGVKIQDIKVFLEAPVVSPYDTNPKQITGTLNQNAFKRPTYSQFYDNVTQKWSTTGWTGIEIDNNIFNMSLELDEGQIRTGYTIIGCMDLVTHHYYYFGLHDMLAAIKEYGVVNNVIHGRFFFRRGGKVYITPVVKV